jgi:enamine deaminase RidA (YjgF/YER057c/UK114 family)
VSSAGSRLLHTAGVVPIAPDGSVPEDLADQAAVVWANIESILAEAGFHLTDIVSMTTYVVAGSDTAVTGEVRDRVLAGHLAASTLIPVVALNRPEWKLEITVVAAAG